MDNILDALLKKSKFKDEQINVNFLPRRVGLDYKFKYEKINPKLLMIKPVKIKDMLRKKKKAKINQGSDEQGRSETVKRKCG